MGKHSLTLKGTENHAPVLVNGVDAPCNPCFSWMSRILVVLQVPHKGRCWPAFSAAGKTHALQSSNTCSRRTNNKNPPFYTFFLPFSRQG